MKRTLLALGLVLAGTGAAFAYGPSTPGIDHREANQQRRIHQGMRDGSLNHREAARLVERQRRIRALEAAARADGHISTQERMRLHRMQREASRDIWMERHDRQHRYAPSWNTWR